MPATFEYRARDAQGKPVQGRLPAESVEAVMQQLRRDGLTVQQVRPVDTEDDDSEGFELLPRRISRERLLYVTRQLAIMSETGITLSQAMGAILEQEEHPKLRKVLGELKSAVESGDDFSEALARHPAVFDKIYVALIRASESSGALAEMLERIADYLQKEAETRNKVRAAMAYPLVMAVLASAVSIFLLTYIFPKFTPLFERKGMDLPTPTLVMMFVSNGLLHYWYLWLLGVAAAVAGLIVSRRTEQGRMGLDWIKINVPIMGPMFRKVIISRGIRTLGTMLASGVPLLESLRLCAEVSSNCFYSRLWRHVEARVTEGSTICSALGGSSLMPRTLIQMISSGEETGKLDAVLDHVSGFYDKEVESAVKTATSLIEPLMMVAMGVVVGGIAMALMLPIFTLSRPS